MRFQSGGTSRSGPIRNKDSGRYTEVSRFEFNCIHATRLTYISDSGKVMQARFQCNDNYYNDDDDDDDNDDDYDIRMMDPFADS